MGLGGEKAGVEAISKPIPGCGRPLLTQTEASVGWGEPQRWTEQNS